MLYSTLNNFELVYQEVESETIPLKHKMKRCALWETEAIIQKRGKLNKVAKMKTDNPSGTNIAKFKKPQIALAEICKAEQIAYVHHLKSSLQSTTCNSLKNKEQNQWL